MSDNALDKLYDQTDKSVGKKAASPERARQLLRGPIALKMNEAGSNGTRMRHGLERKLLVQVRIARAATSLRVLELIVKAQATNVLCEFVVMTYVRKWESIIFASVFGAT